MPWANTFREEDGYRTVSYDGYDSFASQLGHLLLQGQFFLPIVAVVYRFVGEQAKDVPGWATRNSGIMVHGLPFPL